MTAIQPVSEQLAAIPLQDLEYMLRQQEYKGVSTWGNGLCGHPARGCGICADCLRAEIKARKALTEVGCGRS